MVTLARTRDLLDEAVVRAAAVPAFNAITLEQAESIVAGASAAGSAVLIQVSQNAILSRRGFAPLLAACRELASDADTPIAIHIDHLDDEDLAREIIAAAPRLGVASVMFDASTLPYAQNVDATRRLARQAHDAGLWVEGELGEVAGKRGAHASGARTDPAEAADFVAQTEVDLLAVAVGTSHAMTERSAHVDADLIHRLSSVPVPLVLHGSSGLSDHEIGRAVAAGIRKVNIGTALNIAGSAELRAALAAQPDAIDPRAYGRTAQDATARLVEQYCRVVAGTGQPTRRNHRDAHVA